MKYLSLITSFAVCVAGSGYSNSVHTWGAAHTAPPPGVEAATQVSVALDHSLVLKSNGTIVAWGYNSDGQCDIPPGLSAIQCVAAGEFFSLAAKSNGLVVAWGDNDYGQCIVPGGLSGVVSLSGGRGHVLARKSNGTVVSWGNNDYGQTNVPPGLTGVMAVHAEWNYSMALRSNGTVVVWGANDYGQMSLPGGLGNVTAIDGNQTYCLALKSDGTVVAWGRPPAVPQWLSQVKAVAAGDDHCLALRSDGSVVAWGSGNAGQLEIPAAITKAVDIAAGWHFNVAISGSDSIALVAFNPSWQAGSFRVSIPSEQGVSYRLEYKDTFSESTWTALVPVIGTGNPIQFVDDSASVPARAYRIRRD